LEERACWHWHGATSHYFEFEKAKQSKGNLGWLNFPGYGLGVV
jgi:hypothetical protein